MINKSILFLFILLTTSCLFRSKSKYIIPENKFIAILTDIHMADAIAGSYEFRQRYEKPDSIIYSDYIFEKYGYNRSYFDSTLHYYVGRPERLERVYDQVMANLSKIEGDLGIEVEVEETITEPIDIWNQKPNWFFPEDGEKNKLSFHIETRGTGNYTITADIRMNENDESINPMITAYFWHKGDDAGAYRDSFPISMILKNNTFETHSITKLLSNPDVTHIRGSILDHESQEGEWSKHVEVQNINIMYEPVQ